MLFTLIKQLISNLFFFALHVSEANSFPPPLSAKKEAELAKKDAELTRLQKLVGEE